MLKDNWFIFIDINKLSKRLASDILAIAEQSIKLSDSFKIVLAGGASLIKTYKILSDADSDWSKWHVYIGDERCLPTKDKDRNDYAINEAWLNNSLIPKQNINFIQSELGARKGALYYEKTLKNVGYFDVVLLGMGEDGHTASLFPDHLYDKNKSVVVECNSPKYPKERISMSYSRFNKSKHVFKVINGHAKKGTVSLWLKGKKAPISEINGDFERVYICKDVLPILYASNQELSIRI